MSDKDNRDRLRRRKILKVIGAGALPAVAGCSGQQDGNGTSTTISGPQGGINTNTPVIEGTSTSVDGTPTDGEGTETQTDAPTQIIDQTLDLPGGNTVPKDGQANEYRPANWDDHLSWMIFDYLGVYSPNRGQVGILATDWRFTGETLEVDLQPGQQWHNGEPFTAEDVRVKMMCEKIIGGSVWDFLEEVKTPSEKTVEFVLSSSNVNRQIMMGNLFQRNMRMNTPRFVFGDFVEMYEDGSEDQAQEELATFKWPVTDVVGNGPFRLVDADSQRYKYELWENHPASPPSNGHPSSGEVLNFPSMEMHYMPEAQPGVPIQNDETDWGSGPRNQQFYQDIPENLRLIQIPTFDGTALSFNYDDDLFAKRQFRRAIQYATDREKISGNMGFNYTKVNSPSGIATNVVGSEETWIPNLAGKLETYDQDLEKATSLLKEAGCTRENSEWYRPNGDRLEFQIKSPPWASYPIGMETAASQLSEFGIAAEVLSMQSSPWITDWQNDAYQATFNFWGAWHPFMAFDCEFRACTNAPEEFEVPWPVGDMEGSLKTINVNEKITELSQSSGEDATQLIEELAWTVNQAIPEVIWNESFTPNLIRTDDWNWPAEDHWIWGVQFTQYALLKFGLLQAKS